jgi:hypothetical protein
MELTALIRLEAKVRRLERAAVHSLLEKDFYLAEMIIQHALSLQATSMSKRLMEFIRHHKRRRLGGMVT